MPIPVECPFCFENYQVLEKLSGRTIKCRACGNPLEVPRRAGGSSGIGRGADESRSEPPRRAPAPAQSPARRGVSARDDDEFDGETEAQPTRRRRAPAKSGGLPSWLLPVGLAGGALGLLALCGGLLISFFSRNQVPVGGGAVPPGPPPEVSQFQAGTNPAQTSGFGQPPGQVPPAGGLGAPPNAGPAGVNPGVPPAGSPPLAANGGMAPAGPAGVNPGGFQPPPVNPPVANPPPANPPAGQPAAPNLAGGAPANNPNRGPKNPERPVAGFQPPPEMAAPQNWRVQIDPLEPVDQAEEAKLAPLSLPVGDDRLIVFPWSSCRYVALGGGSLFDGIKWDVREVGTGRAVGVVSEPKLRCEHWALAPDGRHLAATQRGPSQVLVWDVKQGKRLGQLPLENGFVKEVLFAGPSRLLVLTSPGGLRVFALPEGREVRTVAGEGGSSDPERMGFSPGGRYLVTTKRDSFDLCTLEVTDLETGELAGRTQVSELQPTDRSRLISDFHVKSIVFSPDGTELAVVFDTHQKVGIAVVDVATGKQLEGFTCEHLAADQAFGRREVKPALDWFPNKQRWLYQGLGLIDRASRKMVWTMPDAKASIPHGMPQSRRVHDDQTVWVAGGLKGQVVLQPYTIPLEEVAKSAEVVAAGGLAVDAKLPPLTAMSAANAPKLDTTAGGARLELSPDPAPQGQGELLSQPLALPARPAPLQAARLSSTRAARLVTLYGPESRGGQESEGDSELLVMDLAKRSQVTQFALPGASDLLGADLDGAVALTRLQASDGRVDLFDLTGGTPLLAWRPYGEAEHAHQQKVAGAVVIDKDHVLTLSQDNRLVLWDLPGRRAVYQIERAELPGVSPGRRWLTVWSGQGVRVFDARTGEVKGDLRLPNGEQSSAFAGAFHPRGDRLAVCLNAYPCGRVVVWNIASGQVEYDFVQPRLGRTLHWCGDQHLLLDNTALVDLQKSLLVWNYELPRGKGVHVPDSPDGRHWYLTSSGGQQASVTLVAAQLPDAGVTQRLAGRKLEPEYLLKPGSRVGVRFNFTSTPPKKPNFQDEVWKGLQQSLARAGMVYDEKSPLVYVLHLSSRSTGKNHEFRVTSFGLGGGPRQVSVPGLEAESGLEVWNGNERIYDSKQKFVNDSFFVSIRDGVSVEEFLNEQMWNSATGGLLSPVLPRYLLPASAREGLGKSELTVSGVR